MAAKSHITSRRGFLVAAGASVAAAGLPVPASAQAAERAEALSRLSMEELHVAYDAAHAAARGWLSIHNQPRCTGAADDFVQDELERCEGLVESIAKIALNASPTDPKERRQRMLILMAYGTEVDSVTIYDAIEAGLPTLRETA